MTSIPDSISTQQLRQLLQGAQPFLLSSPKLPALDFREERGGLVEITLLLTALIAGANSQPNAAQLVLLVLTLLQQLHRSFEAEIASMETRDPVPDSLESISDVAASFKKAQDALLPAAIQLTELATLLRLDHMSRSIPDYEQLSLQEREALVLVSDEFLADLGLSRADVLPLLRTLFPFRSRH